MIKEGQQNWNRLKEFLIRNGAENSCLKYPAQAFETLEYQESKVQAILVRRFDQQSLQGFSIAFFRENDSVSARLRLIVSNPQNLIELRRGLYSNYGESGEIKLKRVRKVLLGLKLAIITMAEPDIDGQTSKRVFVDVSKGAVTISANSANFNQRFFREAISFPYAPELRN